MGRSHTLEDCVTANKHRKQRIRERMAKTGESYMQAMHALERESWGDPTCRRCRRIMTHGERDICNECRAAPLDP